MTQLSFDMGKTMREGGFSRDNQVQSFPDGDFVCRIAPPFGTSNNGVLYKYYRLHWGFMGPNGKKKPVMCSFMTEGRCPVCERVKAKYDEKDRALAQGNKDLAKEAEIFISEHGARKVYVYNMIDKSGAVSMRGATQTVHDELLRLIQDAVEVKGIDPCAFDGGVWFKVSKTGKGFNTAYRVDYNKSSEKVGDDIIEKIDRSPLDEKIAIAIRSQITGTGAGPLKDIHVAHVATSYAELEGLMGGELVARDVPKTTYTPPVAAPAPTIEAPKAEAPVTPAAPSVGVSVNDSHIMAEIERMKSLLNKKP